MEKQFSYFTFYENLTL